jgi:hypothetical protein
VDVDVDVQVGSGRDADVAMIRAVLPAHEAACKPRAPSLCGHIRSGMRSRGTIARQPPARNVSTT